MEQKIDIAIIGECLIELSANGSLADTSTLNKYFGGDTVTTAVALARLGGNVTYLTKVGNDGFSEFIISSLRFSKFLRYVRRSFNSRSTWSSQEPVISFL